MKENGQIHNEKPMRYLGLAIISTFLFWPLGLVAIFKSLKVDDYYAIGNPEMAFCAAQDAKRFGIMAVLIGIVLKLIVLIIVAFCVAIAAISASKI